MPNAARLHDPTDHDGIIIGPGCSTVLIGGLPAATVGDMTINAKPSNAPNIPGYFLRGSETVFIGGKPALRQGDTSSNGATILTGSPNVIIK